MSLNRRVGALAFPVTTGVASFNVLLPAQGILLDLFTAAIRTDLGTPWATASGQTSLWGRNVVNHAAQAQPTQDYLQTIKTDFPALFVYPLEESSSAAFTAGHDATTQRWCIEYILGPLDPAELRQIGGIFRTIELLVQEVILVGGHPAYAMAPGGTQPQQILYWDGSDVTIDDVTTAVPGCGFSSVKLIGSTKGAASFAEGSPVYHGVRLTLETTEIGEAADPDLGWAPHLGANFDITGDAAGDMDVGDPDDDDPDGLGDFRSDISED